MDPETELYVKGTEAKRGPAAVFWLGAKSILWKKGASITPFFQYGKKHAKRIKFILTVRHQMSALNASERSSAWILTINNPTEFDDEQIHTARRRGWKCIGQKEQGEDGTPHYQMVVRTGQVRFSAVKKVFTRAHIEACENPIACETYCTKPETRIGDLPPEENRYPTMNQVYELWWGWLVDEGYGYSESVISDNPLLWRPNEGTRVADGDQLLIIFDKFVRAAIASGERVEVLAVNPQIRSSIKKFGFSILKRTRDSVEQKVLRKTKTNEDAVEVAPTDPTDSTNNADEKERSKEARNEEARGKEAGGF